MSDDDVKKHGLFSTAIDFLSSNSPLRSGKVLANEFNSSNSTGFEDNTELRFDINDGPRPVNPRLNLSSAQSKNIKSFLSSAEDNNSEEDDKIDFGRA